MLNVQTNSLRSGVQILTDNNKNWNLNITDMDENVMRVFCGTWWGTHPSTLILYKEESGLI